MWGVLLLFIGGVLLLENFNVIEFYWRNVWRFWPVLLIILGINILFNKNNKQVGSIISLVIMLVTLSFLFVKGQQVPSRNFWWGDKFDRGVHIDIDDDDTSYSELSFSEPFVAGDANKNTILNLSAGGTSFELKGATDSLIYAEMKKRNGQFMLTKEVSDTVNIITFKMQGKNQKNNSWSLGDGGNDVSLHLNTSPVWDMRLKMGAGQVDFDLANYKVRHFNFNGGAAELNIKLGNLLPLADVHVKTGVADVTISIPESSGCRIQTKTGLSSKDFVGFTKLDNGLYETPNYQAAANKILINLDGGLSSFEVKRY